ncbi:MAG: hypothetical protein IJW74_00145, partial [Oscillospiraceae bacterium]|nr:hypothetical protein [Oscillospiraceae bacterium]
MAEYKKRKKKKNFLPILIVIALLVYFVVQWYLINRNKIETVKANEGFINDSILTMGIVCREEAVMNNISDGYFYYNVENGQRVSSGMLIGQVYSSQSDIDNIHKSNDIEKQIANLEEAENFMSSVNVDISITRRQLSSSMVNFSQQLAEGIFSNVYENVQDMTL